MARPPGLIEIALSDGTTVRVDAQIDPRALRDTRFDPRTSRVILVH